MTRLMKKCEINWLKSGKKRECENYASLKKCRVYKGFHYESRNLSYISVIETYIHFILHGTKGAIHDVLIYSSLKRKSMRACENMSVNPHKIRFFLGSLLLKGLRARCDYERLLRKNERIWLLSR